MCVLFFCQRIGKKPHSLLLIPLLFFLLFFLFYFFFLQNYGIEYRDEILRGLTALTGGAAALTLTAVITQHWTKKENAGKRVPLEIFFKRKKGRGGWAVPCLEVDCHVFEFP